MPVKDGKRWLFTTSEEEVLMGLVPPIDDAVKKLAIEWGVSRATLYTRRKALNIGKRRERANPSHRADVIGLGLKTSAKEASEELGLSRNKIYKIRSVMRKSGILKGREYLPWEGDEILVLLRAGLGKQRKQLTEFRLIRTMVSTSRKIENLRLQVKKAAAVDLDVMRLDHPALSRFLMLTGGCLESDALQMERAVCGWAWDLVERWGMVPQMPWERAGGLWRLFLEDGWILEVDALPRGYEGPAAAYFGARGALWTIHSPTERNYQTGLAACDWSGRLQIERAWKNLRRMRK